MQAPQGSFTLQRRPRRRRELLRAWDAADEYLLREVAEQIQPGAGMGVLVVNDSFGALAVALAFGLGGREVAERELESWVATVHEEGSTAAIDASVADASEDD